MINKTKTGLKPSRTHTKQIKSYSSMSSSQGTQWHNVCSKGPGCSCLCGLADGRSHDRSLGLALLTVCCFSQQALHISGT